ncbi:MAG: MBL fold metallo-hydrolase [Desulfobacterales bacterium]
MKIFFVGAGTPTPTQNRFGTCYVVRIDKGYLMFDCGPAATHKMVKMGLFPTQVDYLFFSHHHFDHNADYPCFLLCRWDQGIGRENPLRVFGPAPTEWITDRLIGPDGAFNHDWRARVGHPGSQDIFVGRGGRLPRPEPQVDVKNIDAGAVIEDAGWKVTAARCRHIEPWMPTLAYRLEASGKRIVFSSDTGVCQSVIELARGANYLVIHCWGHQDTMKRAESGMITGTVDAAKLAAEAGVETLVLSHIGHDLDRPGSREKALLDLTRFYKGQIIWADELMTLDLQG